MGQEDRQEAGGTHRAARRADREIPEEDSTDSRRRAGSRTGTVPDSPAMVSQAIISRAIISPDSGP